MQPENAARAQKCAQCAHPLWPDKHAMCALSLARRRQLPRNTLAEKSDSSCRHHNPQPRTSEGQQLATGTARTDGTLP